MRISCRRPIAAVSNSHPHETSIPCAGVHTRARSTRLQDDDLEFLCDDAAFGVQEYPVAIAVAASRKVVVIRLPFGADDLAARQPQQRDDGCQVLEKRDVVRGRRLLCEERHEWEYQSRSQGACD